MAVTITNEELDLFNKNGFSDDDVRATVENYRRQGLDDNDIRAKVQSRLDSWATPKNVELPKSETPTLIGGVQTFGNGEYDDILTNPNLTKEQKALEIQKRGEAQRKQYDKDLNKWKAKAYTGLGLELASAAIPFGAGYKIGKIALNAGKPIAKQVIANMAKRGAVEGALSGAVGGIGQGMIEDKNAGGIAKNALIGSAVGALSGGAIGAAGGKIATKGRIENIDKRRATPLAERMSEEQLNNATIQPSQFGVNKIDSAKNKQLAENLEKRLNQEDLERQAEQELLNEYKTLRQQMSDKYGGLNKLREQAIKGNKAKSETGEISEALNDYQNLISYEQELGNAKYIKSDLAPLATGKFRAKQAKPKIKEEVTENIIKPTVQEEKIVVPHKISGVEKQRGGISTVAKNFGNDTAKQITNNTYSVRGKDIVKAEFDSLTPEQKIGLVNSADDTSDLATYAKAEYLKNEISKGNTPISVLNKWVSIGTKKGQELQAQKFLAPDTLEGAIVQMQNAIFKAQSKKAQKLLTDAEEIASQIKNLSPEQKVKKIDKLLANYALAGKKRKNFVDKLLELDNLGGLNGENITKLINKEFKIPEINQTDIENLGKLVTKIKNAQTTREKDIATQLIAKTINKKLPRNIGDIDQTYRTINMLLSPKSRSKDAISTLLYQGERFVDEAFAKIPALISRARGFQTRDLGFDNKEWWSGLKRGLKEVNEDIKLGINTGRSGEGARFDLTNSPQFEGVPVMEQAEKLLNYTIRGIDRPFYEAAFEASVANQMKARGLTEPTEDIIEQAILEGKQAVFQRNGMLSQLGSAGRDFLNAKGTPLEKLRLGQRNIPFLQTIANLTQEGFNATPFTLPTNLYKYFNAKTLGELRDAELALGKNLKGLSIYAPLGYALSKKPENTNIGELNSLESSANDVTGMPAQGIVIGDKAISLANMPQTTIPIAVYKNLFGSENIPQGIINGTLQSIATLSDLPAFKGIGDMIKGGGDITKAITKEAQGTEGAISNAISNIFKQYASNQLSQYIPFGGALGNIRNIVDPNNRELMTYNENPTIGNLEYIGNRLQNRIPFASSLLPMKYNVIGEPSLRTNIDNGWARGFGELFDPFSIRNYKKQPAEMEEMQRIQDYVMVNDITGKTTLKFAKPKRYIKKDDEKINLTNEQYSELTRLYNGKLYDELQFLMNTPEYQSSDEETQIKWVREVMKDMKEQAENELLGE